MRNPLFIVTAAALRLLSTVVRSQNPPVDFDFKAAESWLESNAEFGANKVPNPVRKSLHEAQQAPNGTRGYGGRSVNDKARRNPAGKAAFLEKVMSIFTAAKRS